MYGTESRHFCYKSAARAEHQKEMSRFNQEAKQQKDSHKGNLWYVWMLVKFRERRYCAMFWVKRVHQCATSYGCLQAILPHCRTLQWVYTPMCICSWFSMGWVGESWSNQKKKKKFFSMTQDTCMLQPRPAYYFTIQVNKSVGRWRWMKSCE